MALSIGEQLKSAREEKRLTIDQAAKETHIRVHYLQALEQDRRDQLPSNVQGRGFLRLYADYLGLTAPSLLASWDGKPASTPVSSQPIAPRDDTQESVTAAVQDLAESSEDPAGFSSSAQTSIKQLDAPPLNTTTEQTSEAILKTIGETLRRQRELLSLKLADAEHFTHVRTHYLQALEKGAIGDLPSPVQARGMLNNYARFLGLDSEELLLRFAEALQTRRTESYPRIPASTGVFSRKRPAFKPTGLRRLLTPDLLIGGALVLLLLGFAVWTAAQVSAFHSDQTVATVPAIGNVLLATPLVTGSATPSSEPRRTATPTPSGPGGAAAGPQDQSSTLDGTLQVTAKNDMALQVYIVARQRSFLRVTADKKVVFNGRIVPGNAYPYSAKDTIELLTGNAAGLQILFNNTDLGTLGNVGDVLHLVFNKNGVQTPTPSSSLTPTPTIQATITLVPSPTLPSPTVTPFIP